MARKKSYSDIIRDHISAVVADRQIEVVLHFTRLENLPTIFRYGLLPRAQAREIEENVLVSDADRLDEEDGAVSVSISCYYSKMFEAKHHRSNEQNWAILRLYPNVLWEHHCRFYAQGASTKAERYDVRKKYGGYALEKLFEDFALHGNEPSLRTGSNIPRSWPTFPDAEVQVMGPIGARYIGGVSVEASHHEDWVRTLLTAAGRTDCDVTTHSFEPRHTYRTYAWG